MVDLQELVANYPLVQPAVAFAGGAVMGLGVRVFQSFFPTKRVEEGKREYWLPGGSLFTGLYLITSTESRGGLALATMTGALVGDYATTRIVDRFIDGKL